MQIRLPNSVSEMDDDVFDRNDIIIITPKDSYAQEWAIRNGFSYITEQ